ncbi:MAG: lytic transglycosylase domain-containing protein [Actinomycetota bacterium]|nr:lytic transglycosylase domain-containing protein [Actinomycetota bacterium]
MKRVSLVSAILVFLLLFPLLLVGVLLSLSGDQPSPSELALSEIPHELIGVYEASAATCEGLDWTVLAAIHKVETRFGTGRATSSAGAQGPMQFMPPTFEAYGVDGDGDGRADINDVDDAIFSAANLLCANGAGDPERLATAVWNYNHSQAYVNEVLTLAASYGVISLPEGVAYAAATDLLRNPRVVLTPNARADLEAGAVDERLVSLLSWIAQRHTITISVFKTGHSKYTRSGSVSNHYYGRGADIFIVDGSPVSSKNDAAYRVVLEIAGLEGALRPSELGHPFGAVGFPGGFTDADHRDHIHFGFD